MTFADCKYFEDKLRNEQLPLCEDKDHPPGKRPVSHFYVWEQPQIFFYPGGGGQFAPYKSDLARDFAKKAIMAQPGDYAKTVIGDFARTFRWDRPVYPDPKTYSYYVFPKTDQAYWPDKGPLVEKYDAQKTATRVIEPYAGFMRGYQQVVRLPGTILGFFLLIGLAGVLVRWRRFGGVAIFPFGIAMALLVIPPATVLFDYRYVAARGAVRHDRRRDRLPGLPDLAAGPPRAAADPGSPRGRARARDGVVEKSRKRRSNPGEPRVIFMWTLSN